MADGKCRITGHTLEECIDLGDQFVTDFVEPGQETQAPKGSLRLGIGPQSGLVQLFESIPPETMYRRYWYRSGINDSMRTELKSIVESAMSFVRLRAGDTVLDIASNDGTLLSFYPTDVNRIGVDPSNVAADSELYGGKISLVNDFFSERAFRTVCEDKAKIVTVIAMFYDLEDPLGFLRQVRNIIDDCGVLTLQLSYTPLMLEQNEFGNICHEHVCYYTLENLSKLLNEAGFEVFDVHINPTNGGSIRVYATPTGSTEHLTCPLNWLSIGKARVKGTLEYERHEKLCSPEPYVQFMERVERLKRETVEWLQHQKEIGKRVVGYGASTKGNVLLQYYGIGPDLVPCIAEANKKKWGLCTVGTGIPIISEQEMRKMKPDYLLVFPWFFTSYFMDRERDLLSTGTQLVVPQPEFRIIKSDHLKRQVREPQVARRAA
jgi:hypothetical protein